MAGANISPSVADAAAMATAVPAPVVDIAERDQVLKSTELASLVELGRERGFVTTLDLAEALDAAGLDATSAKVFARHLRRASIPIVDASSVGEGVAPTRVEPSAAATVDTVRLYLNEIGRVDLLMAEEEVDLAKRVDAGREAAEILDSRVDIGIEQRVRLRRIEREGRTAKRHLNESNLRLVVSIAKRYV